MFISNESILVLRKQQTQFLFFSTILFFLDNEIPYFLNQWESLVSNQ